MSSCAMYINEAYYGLENCAEKWQALHSVSKADRTTPELGSCSAHTCKTIGDQSSKRV